MHEKKSGLVCLTVIRVKKSSRCKTLTNTADYHQDSMIQQHTSSHTNSESYHSRGCKNNVLQEKLVDRCHRWSHWAVLQSIIVGNAMRVSLSQKEEKQEAGINLSQTMPHICWQQHWIDQLTNCFTCTDMSETNVLQQNEQWIRYYCPVGLLMFLNKA